MEATLLAPVIALLQRKSFPSCSVFAGFDGAVDKIYSVLASRGLDGMKPMDTIGEFARCIEAAANRSTNIGRILREIRAGGNAVLCGKALAKLGCGVTLVANLGLPLDENFRLLAGDMISHSWGQPNRTDALEFRDGKIMLVDSQPLEELTYGNLIRSLAVKNLGEMFAGKRAVVLTNWTMTPHATEIYETICRQDLPHIPDDVVFFFDIADPARRSNEEIGALLDVLAHFGQTHSTFLSLNLKELERMSQIFGREKGMEDRENFLRSLHNRFPVEWIIHRPDGADSFGMDGYREVPGFFTPSPITTTGGGDVFNGGFLFGHLNGLSRDQSLFLANAVSGTYVRRGRSPERADVFQFLQSF
jgi:hypothetical protein